jgi:ankyrin repeat protein
MDTPSAILTALYQRHPDEAWRLARAAESLTIWEAAALGMDEAIEAALARRPADVNAFAPDGHTPLGLAAFFARPSTVRLLLARGADVTVAARNPMQVQPLHAAVAGRSAEVVELLLACAPDVNARQQVGYTPLMGAASSGREDLVQLLLRHAADRSLVAEDGQTAAAVAREHGHATLADTLSA